MEQTGKFSNGRAALGLLALVILAAAQLGAQLLASLPLMVGAPVWLGNVLAGVLYAALGVAGLLLLCGKGLRVTPEECRFAPVRLRPVWAASAVLMPALAARCCVNRDIGRLGLRRTPRRWRRARYFSSARARASSRRPCSAAF